MNIKSSLTVALVLTLLNLTLASAGDDPYTMKTLDANGDKKISRDELWKNAHQHFTRLDLDRSGKIEIKTECAGSSAAWCSAADQNKDGSLELPEFLNHVDAAFRKADGDKDKRLNEAELKGAVLLRF